MAPAVSVITVAIVSVLFAQCGQGLFFPFLNLRKEFHLGKDLPFFGGGIGAAYELNIGKYPTHGLHKKKALALHEPYHGYGYGAGYYPGYAGYGGLKPGLFGGLKPGYGIGYGVGAPGLAYGGVSPYAGFGGPYGGYGYGGAPHGGRLYPNFITPMGGLGGFNYNSVGNYMRHRHKTVTIDEQESGAHGHSASGFNYHGLAPYGGYYK